LNSHLLIGVGPFGAKIIDYIYSVALMVVFN